MTSDDLVIDLADDLTDDLSDVLDFDLAHFRNFSELNVVRRQINY